MDILREDEKMSIIANFIPAGIVLNYSSRI